MINQAAAAKRGRPRASGAESASTRQDILDAAAQLFCGEGYGSTSTHAIARTAGIRQASLYHYFAGKHEILLALLLGTVAPSLAAARALLERDERPEVRLWALCYLDVRLLCAGEVNLGSLYLLPELADARFAEFDQQRAELLASYAELIGACEPMRSEVVPQLADMVLALVESVILRRRKVPRLDADDLAPRIADAALRILDVRPETINAARTQGAVLIDQL